MVPESPLTERRRSALATRFILSLLRAPARLRGAGGGAGGGAAVQGAAGAVAGAGPLHRAQPGGALRAFARHLQPPGPGPGRGTRPPPAAGRGRGGHPRQGGPRGRAQRAGRCPRACPCRATPRSSARPPPAARWWRPRRSPRPTGRAAWSAASTSRSRSTSRAARRNGAPCACASRTEDVHRQVRATRLALLALAFLALALGALGSIWMARRITGPLSDLVARHHARGRRATWRRASTCARGDEIEELAPQLQPDDRAGPGQAARRSRS